MSWRREGTFFSAQLSTFGVDGGPSGESGFAPPFSGAA
jgi:hypothetical protein